MGAVTPETCRVVLQWINICILLHLLEFYSHWITMHGAVSLKKSVKTFHCFLSLAIYMYMLGQHLKTDHRHFLPYFFWSFTVILSKLLQLVKHNVCLLHATPTGTEKQILHFEYRVYFCSTINSNHFQWCTEGGGDLPHPEIPKALQNRAKLNPIVKTVKNCWI